MFLFELFDDNNSGSDLIGRLRQTAIDILTPMAAQGVPFVTVQSMIDQFQQLRTGIDVDSGLVMNVLDPNKVKMITKVEGDKIYFSTPSGDDRAVTDTQKQQDANHVAQQAATQAKKNVTS